jgi:hypothetical protein
MNSTIVFLIVIFALSQSKLLFSRETLELFDQISLIPEKGREVKGVSFNMEEIKNPTDDYNKIGMRLRILDSSNENYPDERMRTIIVKDSEDTYYIPYRSISDVTNSDKNGLILKMFPDGSGQKEVFDLKLKPTNNKILPQQIGEFKFNLEMRRTEINKDITSIKSSCTNQAIYFIYYYYLYQELKKGEFAVNSEIESLGQYIEKTSNTIKTLKSDLLVNSSQLSHEKVSKAESELETQIYILDELKSLSYVKLLEDSRIKSEEFKSNFNQCMKVFSLWSSPASEFVEEAKHTVIERRDSDEYLEILNKIYLGK